MARKKLDGDLQAVATTLAQASAQADAAADAVRTALRAYREAHDLTQAALAARLGVSRVTVARVEVGLRKPSAQLVRALEKLGGAK